MWTCCFATAEDAPGCVQMVSTHDDIHTPHSTYDFDDALEHIESRLPPAEDIPQSGARKRIAVFASS
jgi:hypothetical protein